MIKRILVIGGLATVLGIVVYFIASYGFIELQTDKSQQGLEYRLIRDGKEVSKKTNQSGSVKFFTKRGDYEYLVKRGLKNSYGLVSNKGFLQTTKFTTTLGTEKTRQFVGNNPSPCMNYISSILISYNCDGPSFDQTQIHAPATPSQPTYNVTNSDAPDYIIESLQPIDSIGKSVALVKLPDTGDGVINAHYLYEVTSPTSLNKITGLPKLDDESDYSMKPFGSGLIIFSTDFRDVWKFDFKNNSLTELQKPDTIKEFLPSSLSSYGSTYVIMYEKRSADNQPDPHERNATDSKFAIYKGGKKTIVSKGGQFSSVLLCGDDLLCLTDETGMATYKISGSKLKRQFFISDVRESSIIHGKLVIVKGNMIISLDTEKKQGSADIVLDNQNTCGFGDALEGYIICVIHNSSKIALYINPLEGATSAIDKKVFEIEKIKDVRSVSAYKNLVYIAPNYGEPEYDANLNNYIISDSVITRINSQINQSVERIGIDRTKYQVIIGG